MANVLDVAEDDLFFQCAQDPLADFDERYPILADNAATSEVKPKRGTKKRRVKSKVRCSKWKVPSSFVQSREAGKATKIIKISIVDIEDSKTCASESDRGNVLVKAHYLVKENNDEILSQTERLINNISKKLCGYSTCIYM